jgi:hypothetical protein
MRYVSRIRVEHPDRTADVYNQHTGGVFTRRHCRVESKEQRGVDQLDGLLQYVRSHEEKQARGVRRWEERDPSPSSSSLVGVFSNTLCSGCGGTLR